jgi:SagB-type dehydrogenase family enzyme
MKMIYSKLFFAAFVTCFYFTSPAQVIKSIQLPAPQKDIGKPLMQVLNSRQSTRVFTTKQLPIQEISNLLWAAFGINRTDEGKRTAPSARNWQDIDIYVFLPEGVYIYRAKDNKLEQISNVDLRSLAGVQDFVKTAPLNLVYVSDQSKMGTASDLDKMMYSGADAGFIAQNVYLYCASQDLGVVVRAMVDKKTLAEKLNLKQGQVIVLAQTIGYKK